jgi:hypothetical protein
VEPKWKDDDEQQDVYSFEFKKGVFFTEIFYNFFGFGKISTMVPLLTNSRIAYNAILRGIQWNGNLIFRTNLQCIG